MTEAADRQMRLAAGGLALLLVTGFLGGAFATLLGVGGEAPPLRALASDPYLRGVVGFTLLQASLSALLSVAGAVPLALALHRTRFPGRFLVLRIFLLPQALPVLVGALAIVTVWGRNGIVSDILAATGLPRLDLYGLPGILIAHVFFNLPLAARLMTARLDEVPAESWKLAAQLGLPPLSLFRIVEWPALRLAIPAAVSLVFMLCVTSFTLVLVLGGGPGATTLEVEIYQALHFDFDPPRAIALALAQIGLTAAVLAISLMLGGAPTGGFTLGAQARRYDRGTGLSRLLDGGVLLLALLFILSPFAAILIDGLRADLMRLAVDPVLGRAALTSLAVGLAAATLSLVLALSILMATTRLRRPSSRRRSAAKRIRRLLASAGDIAAGLVLVVPPIVVGAGWFLALRGVADVFAIAPLLVVATNAVMALPFLLHIVGPPLAAADRRNDRLARSLGLTGFARLRHVEWPEIRSPVGLGFAFAMALSLGDLGAIALFGSQDFITLPFLLYERMGSYRTRDAAGLALILGLICLALMVLAERGLRRPEPSR
ncbi:thiamine/thiamine pyrophosphate ABC transporter permease [Mangrovicella endophytica]|uniref:thiamine/thiamine pyrophosphate ABC transporter permease n=1 Tax=Mangrovicella endophytica TaxID=2066697 RepID=UPI000C9EABD0|nr:thiamine/thiamine pyrophosphate ABC transporter permease [Mangrovicella endophytica]